MTQNTFIISAPPTEELAITNDIIINSYDFKSDTEYIRIKKSTAQTDCHHFRIRRDARVKSRELGACGAHRIWAGYKLSEEVTAEPFEPYKENADCSFSKLFIGIELLKNQKQNLTIDSDSLSAHFAKAYDKQIFTLDQKYPIIFEGVKYMTIVYDFEQSTLSDSTQKSGSKGSSSASSGIQILSNNEKKLPYGILRSNTLVFFTTVKDTNLKLVSTSKRTVFVKPVIPSYFNFEDIGIGGLDEEFKIIFRRAFASRMFPRELAAQFGARSIKGILLHGPPGTGKTLMARKIGSMISGREPQVVNGPDILNKFVGQSEENIRKLFRDAEAEYKAKGDASELHIIIFDEIEAICKQRGSRSDGTGVGDNIVAQLLTKMDGVEELKNILVIGMTNRKDLIDEALLRPGRFGVELEISLPNESGRLQILQIHTSTLKKNNRLDPAVSLEKLAQLTSNFTGAEIEDLVQSAISFSQENHLKANEFKIPENVDDLKVTTQDFDCALGEVRPKFGVPSEELNFVMENGFNIYSEDLADLIKKTSLLINKVKTNKNTHLISILLHGKPGSGKSSFASYMALQSGFPFVKLISASSFVGHNEVSKSLAIEKIFNDAYKSPLSFIILDGIESLINYTPIGPKFSETVLQVLSTLTRKRPPKGKKLFIIATTNSFDFLDRLEFTKIFNKRICIPSLCTIEPIKRIIESSEAFSPSETKEIIERLEPYFSQDSIHRFSIGIKTLYSSLEMVEELEESSTEKIEEFIEGLLKIDY